MVYKACAKIPDPLVLIIIVRNVSDIEGSTLREGWAPAYCPFQRMENWEKKISIRGMPGFVT